MRTAQTFILCLFVALSLSAQDKKITFGEIDLETLKMKSYPKDSSVDAVVLYDYADVSFGYMGDSYSIKMEYHGRVKILKKSALERASIQLGYMKAGYEREERLTNIKGFTYNFENGEVKKEKLTKEMIVNEKSSDNYATTKFNLPNVKEGSVIEYTYTIETPFGVSNSPKTWSFQNDIPVEWSEYKIFVPEYFYYKFLMSGYLPLHISENKPDNMRLGARDVGGTAYRFVVKDAPAFKNEPFITTPADYISMIDFELASVNIPPGTYRNFSLDYPAINKTLLDDEEFGGILKRTNFMRDVAKGILAKTKDSTEQIKMAVDYVTEKVKWNGRTSIWSKNLKKLMEKGEGDAADVNFMLICLLRELGYDANPVILSTRNHGRIHEQYAILKKFNCLVAHIMKGGKDYLLDATDKFLPIGALPIHYLNHKGWLVHPTAMRMIDINPTDRDSEYEAANFKINEDGELIGTFSKSYGGYSAWSARTTFKEEGKEKFLENVKKGKPTWTINKAEYSRTDGNAGSMEAFYEVTVADHLTMAGNMIYLKPMLTEGHGENPFKDNERAFPIDFGYPVEETYVANFEIPKGYAAVELPKNVAFSLPDAGGKFTYAVVQNAGKITVTSRLSFRKPLYGADEYGNLKAFYDKIVAKHAEQIVLKKSVNP
jgi:Domain of Unknown Function with PDB structure (DUF3857)/Transglutaminase-like superfamily